MRKIDKVIEQLNNWNSTGTNSKHDPAFKQFVKDFKAAIKSELESVKAVDITFNVGHYYISGFFTCNFTSGTQMYYFSLSDVRCMLFGNKLLVRTAKHNKDWTGGQNNHIEIEEGMFERFFSRLSVVY